jgi:hypothetical protein
MNQEKREFLLRQLRVVAAAGLYGVAFMNSNGDFPAFVAQRMRSIIRGNMIRTILRHLIALLGNQRRTDFLEILPKDSVGAEVGVFKGDFTKHILKRVRPSELHLIDGWWKLHGETFPNRGWHTLYGRLKTRDAYAAVERIAIRHDGGKSTVMHVGDAAECMRALDDNCLDWVYVDSDRDYEHSKTLLEVVKDKIKPGGLIAGRGGEEDSNDVHNGIFRAVNELMVNDGLKLLRTDSFSQWCIAGDDRVEPGSVLSEESDGHQENE